MNIVLLGASGFIGSYTADCLREQGHCVRTPTHHEINFLQLNESSAKKFFEQQNLIVNTVGVMSRHAEILETIHHHAPVQLAKWAQEVGVSRWLQLSALGADAAHSVAFVGSKGRGDDALCNSGLQVNIARPSVVFGRGGNSCAVFMMLARFPILCLPNVPLAKMQAVHVHDVAEGLAKMATQPLPQGAVINMVGASAYTLADYLGTLREVFYSKSKCLIVPLPMVLLKPFLPLTNVISNGFLSSGSMKLLAEGSCADVADFADLLGRMPLGVREFSY